MTLNGGNMNVADTIGYLMPRDVGGKFTFEFSLPFWWFTEQGKAMTEFDGGVLFCDELDKAPVDVKKIMGELMYSGRCGPHKLPPGWVVWGAGNRDLDRSGSTKELFHLINRRVEINVSLHVQSWSDWAFKHGVHPTFIAYAEKNPEVVFPASVPEKLEPYCTPRAFRNALYCLSVLRTCVFNHVCRKSRSSTETPGLAARCFSRKVIILLRNISC